MNAQTQNMPAQSQQSVGLLNLESFELSQRIAKMLSSSTLVPEQYRATIKVKAGKDSYGNMVYRDEPNPNGLSNCVIALNMSNRMGADPLMVMQNLYLIEGRPAWSSQFIMAAINSCGRFSALRFELVDLGEKEVEYTTTEWVDRKKSTIVKKVKIQDMSCVAFAIERETGERIESSKITIEMAVKEGWYGKNGSKWQTMPEQMLRYRAASFFGRVYAPELLMGLRSADEEQDRIIDVTPEKDVSEQADTNQLKREILGAKSPAALDDAENKVLMLSDDAKREELLKIISAQAKKFQPAAEVAASKKPEAVQEEVPLVEEAKEAEKPKRTRTAPKVVEEVPAVEVMQAEKVQNSTSGDVVDAELSVDELKRLQAEAEAVVQQQKQPTSADPIKSQMAKNGLKNQIASAPSVEALKEIAATVRDYKLKLTNDDMGEVLADYAARKTFLENQQDMFAGVEEVSYVDAVIKRIQNAKSQDDINAEYADPAFDDLSSADRDRIDKEAQLRESELQD